MGKSPGPGAADIGATDRPLPWRRIFRRLSLAFGWTPEHILELTIPQLEVYLGEENRDEVALAPEAARRWQQQQRERKAAWIQSHICFDQPENERVNDGIESA